MKWQPISASDLRMEIDAACARMNADQRKTWNAIRVPPEKWPLPPWGDEGGGFWVVAISDGTVIWYNDIEEGFNLSRYTTRGLIDEYWCNQDELAHAVQRIIELATSDGGAAIKLGPPTSC